jgi:hypothetical protein
MKQKHPLKRIFTLKNALRVAVVIAGVLLIFSSMAVYFMF